MGPVNRSMITVATSVLPSRQPGSSWQLDRLATPTYSSYTHVVLPVVGFGRGVRGLAVLPQVVRRAGRIGMTQRRDEEHALSVLQAVRFTRCRLSRGRGPAGDPAAPIVPGMRSPIHHGGGASAGRGEALGGHRTF